MHDKSHKLLLLDLSSLLYSKIELVIIDLTGLMFIPMWDSNLYALVAVEVSCCYPVGCLLKHKEEVGVAVKNIVAMLERQSGEHVKYFWSDNRTKFINLTMDLFCRKNEIIYKTTNPYLPEQNGIAEHAIAIFFEIVHYMLYMASVDLCYWGEAFIYIVYICLLTATSDLKNIVPHKAWTSQKPDIFYLCIWGSFG